MKVTSGGAALAAVSTGACILGGVVGALIVKKALFSSTSDDALPEKWVKMGQIKEILIYPVKSLHGISVNEASLEKLGWKGLDNPLLRDRVFMLVDEEGNSINRKKLPILALLGVNLDGNKLTITYPRNSPQDQLTIDVHSRDDSTRVVKVRNENIRGVIDCGNEVAAWLSKITGKPDIRLVFHPEEKSVRGLVERNSRFHTYRPSHLPAFQEETSYMLMTDESLAAVNVHLGDKPVSHSNFRPTIVVSGIPEPFAEDFWGYMRIGSRDSGPVLKTSLPCQRCKVTIVDPEKGEFRTDGEPLTTLYRLKRPVGDKKVSKLVSKSAILGAHFGVFEGEGSVVKVGDPVYVALL